MDRPPLVQMFLVTYFTGNFHFLQIDNPEIVMKKAGPLV